MNAHTHTEAATIQNGAVIDIPLNKLKLSPKNARRTPHTDAAIEALAASIAAKGVLQAPVVEPEIGEDGQPTSAYLVTIGEGRRLALCLRAKRKEIRKAEAVRCVVDLTNDPHEISLDENITRSDMHPADQFEAFRRLAEERGFGAEEIGARFGASAHVVRQRLRLGAVSPRLMQVYRDGDLTLDQLIAFAISEDHARQDLVYDALSWNREPHVIRRAMMETHVRANDRRAVFVGAEAYAEAGGVILRDLFSEDGGGYFEDSALLDRLTLEKLGVIADEVRAEGWKWAGASIDYPHAHGLRRAYPQRVELSPEDHERLYAAQAEYAALSEEYDGAEELPDDVDAKFGELEAVIEPLSEQRHAYDPDDIARGGVFVMLNHDGMARIERGFIRPEDEAPEPEAPSGTEGEGDHAASDDGGSGDHATVIEDEDADDGKPLSDTLIRDLTAHRTLGLRLALGERPDVAVIAVTHALAAQTFYRGHDAESCLDLAPISSPLAGHADGIEDTEAGRALADRHAAWATRMPRAGGDLWAFVVALDHDNRMALFAHCAALTVYAVNLPWDRRPQALAVADEVAEAVALDMTVYWTPTARTYFSRVTKAHILAAVRQAVSEEAAERMVGMKKQAMAEAAETLLAGTGWLPALLRTADDSEPPVAEASGDYAHAAE